MKEIIYEKVGQRLKFAREAKHITLEEAGKIVGVHKSTILRWENGNTEKFKVPILEALADLYEVNPAWIMGYNVPMEPFQLSNDAISNIYIQLKNLYGEVFLEVLDIYDKLNELGRQKLLEYLNDLVKINEYKKK